LPVGIEIGQRVRERFAHDPSAIGPDPELPQGQARALDREQLLPRAVERDLLFVALTSTSRLRDL
jgi:hypothetical protein